MLTFIENILIEQFFTLKFSLYRVGNFVNKDYSQWGLKPGPPDHYFNAFLTDLGLHEIKSCSIASRNCTGPKCEIVHEPKFT